MWNFDWNLSGYVTPGMAAALENDIVIASLAVLSVLLFGFAIYRLGLMRALPLVLVLGVPASATSAEELTARASEITITEQGRKMLRELLSEEFDRRHLKGAFLRRSYTVTSTAAELRIPHARFGPLCYDDDGCMIRVCGEQADIKRCDAGLLVYGKESLIWRLDGVDFSGTNTGTDANGDVETVLSTNIIPTLDPNWCELRDGFQSGGIFPTDHDDNADFFLIKEGLTSTPETCTLRIDD